MSKYTYKLAGLQLNHVSILIILFIGVFCLNLLIPRDLWVQDEARYGEVLREMMATGDWLVPHLNAHPYPDKPPMYFWIVAAFSALLGPGELAFRLVSLLSTLIATIGVYRLGRSLFGVREAFWATAIFSTCFLTQVVGQINRMDMLLTALTVFSLSALLRFKENKKITDLIWFWCICALAVAVKGPIALLFTVIPAITWSLWSDGWRGFLSLRLATGISILVAMVALWILMVVMQGQEQYLKTIWHQQLVGRAINSWSHKEPFYFYLMLTPILLHPWTALVAQGFHSVRKQSNEKWRLLLSFSLVPLIGISLVSGKLFIYMEPLIPALAVVAGLAAAQSENHNTVSRWLSWPSVLVSLIFAAAIFWVSLNYPVDFKLASITVAGLVLLTALGVALFWANTRNWMFSWMGFSVVLSWLVFGAVLYMLNPLFSARSLGEFIAAQPDQLEIGVVKTTRGILNYYSGRTMQELETGETLDWWQARNDSILIIQTDEISAVFGEKGIPSSCKIHQIFSIELKEYHVLSGC